MLDLALAPGWLLLAAATSLVAGTLRGLTGFGGALVLVPVLSAIESPQVAVPVLFIIDICAAMPLVPAAARRCVWRELLPLCIGGIIATPLGVLILEVIEPDLLRRIAALLIMVLVVVMAAGWRYRKPASPRASMAVGGVSGLMGGAIGLNGPPVILFWLGGRHDVGTVRANVIVYFGIMDTTAIIVFWLNGLFTRPVLSLALVLLPLYALGLGLGSHGFRFASERTFRRLALVVIALAALTSFV